MTPLPANQAQMDEEIALDVATKIRTILNEGPCVLLKEHAEWLEEIADRAKEYKSPTPAAINIHLAGVLGVFNAIRKVVPDAVSHISHNAEQGYVSIRVHRHNKFVTLRIFESEIVFAEFDILEHIQDRLRRAYNEPDKSSASTQHTIFDIPGVGDPGVGDKGDPKD